jgi:hypothetical protein
MKYLRRRFSGPLYLFALFLSMSAWIWGLFVGLQWLLNV